MSIKRVTLRTRDFTYHVSYSTSNRNMLYKDKLPKSVREFIVKNANNCREDEGLYIWESK